MSIVTIRDAKNVIADNFHKTAFDNNKSTHTHNPNVYEIQQRSVLVQVSPTTATPSNVLINNSSVQFRIEDSIDKYSAMYVSMDWVTTGAAVTLSSCAGFIKTLQIFSENGSNLLFNSLSELEPWVTNNMLYTRDQHELTSGNRGTTVAYSGVQTLPANSSGTFLFEIGKSFFNLAKIRSYLVQGNILVKIQFNNSITLNAGNFSSNCILKLLGCMEHSSIKSALLQTAKLNKDVFFHSIARHQEIQNLQPNNKYTIRLSGITNSYVNSCWIIVRSLANSTDPANWFVFENNLSAFEFTNESQQSLCGYSPITRADEKIMYPFQNLFLNYTNARFYRFTEDPVIDFKYSGGHGYAFFNGFNYLNLYTGAITPGAFEITVLAFVNETLFSRNAIIKTTRT